MGVSDGLMASSLFLVAMGRCSSLGERKANPAVFVLHLISPSRGSEWRFPSVHGCKRIGGRFTPLTVVAAVSEVVLRNLGLLHHFT